MAAGCPVIAANLPAHNEVIPQHCLIDPVNIDIWASNIIKIHNEWLKSGKSDRIPNDKLIEHVNELLSPKRHGIELSKAYDEAVRRFEK